MAQPILTVPGGRRNPWLRAPLLVAIGFVLAIAAGTVLLHLEGAVAAGRAPLTWSQALFMSTSATCVTGLSVVDVARELSHFGQVVLLAQIQLGGLGIMTLAFLVLLGLGAATSAGGEVLQSTLGEIVYHYRPRRALLLVVGSTIAIEAAGALFLRTQLDEPNATWKCVFLAISAFCNAGFDNLEQGLGPYHAHWGVAAPLLLLWLSGGLGFIVPAAIASRVRRGRGAPLDLSATMILRAALLLIPLGAVLFALTEGGGLLAGRPLHEQALLCLFQGNTPRTAGFSLVDYGDASRATLFSQSALMLIGSAPCSTAGGMKVTAVWVFFAALWARMLNRDQVLISRRAVPVAVIRQAMIVCVSMLLVYAAMAAVVGAVEPAVRFEAVAFEVASALGTVGLSTGITKGLSEPAHLLLVLAMFIGRLGPLGFVYALVRVRPRKITVRFPESDVCVG